MGKLTDVLNKISMTVEQRDQLLNMYFYGEGGIDKQVRERLLYEGFIAAGGAQTTFLDWYKRR